MMNKEKMDTVGMGMKNGGMTKKMGYMKGGMTKKMGYAKGGMCGASNPAARPVKKVK
jgi:hypothetical protein